jgi:hypothetical protein
MLTQVNPGIHVVPSQRQDVAPARARISGRPAISHVDERNQAADLTGEAEYGEDIRRIPLGLFFISWEWPPIRSIKLHDFAIFRSWK